MNPILIFLRGGWKIFFLLWKKWYIILTIIFLFPSIVSSVQTAMDEENYLIPVFDFGILLTTSDTFLYEDMQNNTEKIIPEFKADEKIINKIDYFGRFTWNLGKRVFVKFWMIFFNFLLFYYFFLSFNKSKKARSSVVALITLAFFQIFISIILLVVNPIEFPEVNLYSKMWLVVKNVLPFRGVYSVFKFIISSIIGGI